MQESSNLYMKRIKFNLKKVDDTGFLVSSLAARNVLQQTRCSNQNILLGRRPGSAHLSHNESLDIDPEAENDNNTFKPFVYEWKDPEDSCDLQYNQEARDEFFGKIKYETPSLVVTGSSRLSIMFEENKNNKNRFFKYAKYDGSNSKQRSLSQDVNIHFDKSLDMDNLEKIGAKILKSTPIKCAVGFFLYLVEEKYPFAIKDFNLEFYELRIANDEGDRDDDFPALEFSKTINDYFIEDLLLIYLKPKSEPKYEKDLQDKAFDILRTFDENAKVVTINSELGFSAIHVAHQYATIHEIIKTYLKKRNKEFMLSTSFYVEHVRNIGAPLNLNSTISEYEPLQFNVAFHERCYAEQSSELSDQSNLSSNPNKNSFSGTLLKSYAGSQDVRLFLQSDKIVLVLRNNQLKSVALGKLPKKKLINMKDISSYECKQGKSRNDPSVLHLKYVFKDRMRKLQIQLNVNDAETLLTCIKKFFRRK